MPYTLLYHPDVLEDDIPSIPQNLQRRISRAIGNRLVSNPEKYALPLRGTLQGYWKLRVGDYRVVFKVVQDEIWILAILHRREVYMKIAKRL